MHADGIRFLRMSADDLTDDFFRYVHDGVPVGQLLVRVVNLPAPGEAAALLTGEGRSLGQLELDRVRRGRGGRQFGPDPELLALLSSTGAPHGPVQFRTHPAERFQSTLDGVDPAVMVAATRACADVGDRFTTASGTWVVDPRRIRFEVIVPKHPLLHGVPKSWRTNPCAVSIVRLELGPSN
jgi:hypothetical protein